MTREDDWIEWTGGECPVPAGTRGLARFRLNPNADPIESPYDISKLRWEHAEYAFQTDKARENNRRFDIVAYRVSPPANSE